MGSRRWAEGGNFTDAQAAGPPGTDTSDGLAYGVRMDEEDRREIGKKAKEVSPRDAGSFDNRDGGFASSGRLVDDLRKVTP